jgi:hypothetical protein
VRPLGNDRSTFPSGPTVTGRDVERLRDEDSVLEVRGAEGDVTFEVTGLVPEFVGVPAGVQQAYVVSVLTDNAFNMTTTAKLLFAGGTNRYVSQDTGNHFDTGTASFVGVRATTSVAAFNFANASVTVVPHTSVFSYGFRIGENFAVSDVQTGNGVVVFENGISSDVTLAVPTAGYVCRGVGVVGNNICAVWRDSARTSIVAVHNRTTGAVISQSAASLPTLSITYQVIIDNGWAVITSGTQIFAAPSDASAAPTLRHTAAFTSLQNRTNTSNNVTSDGYFYFREASNGLSLGRLRLSNNAVSIYPNVFTRLDGDPPVTTATLEVQTMIGISETKMAYGGSYTDLTTTGSPTFPFLSTVALTSPGAVLSDSLLTGYPAGILHSLGRGTNGDLVYALEVTGDDFLVKVTGP